MHSVKIFHLHIKDFGQILYFWWNGKQRMGVKNRDTSWNIRPYHWCNCSRLRKAKTHINDFMPKHCLPDRSQNYTIVSRQFTKVARFEMTADNLAAGISEGKISTFSTKSTDSKPVRCSQFILDSMHKYKHLFDAHIVSYL